MPTPCRAFVRGFSPRPHYHPHTRPLPCPWRLTSSLPRVGRRNLPSAVPLRKLSRSASTRWHGATHLRKHSHPPSAIVPVSFCARLSSPSGKPPEPCGMVFGDAAPCG